MQPESTEGYSEELANELQEKGKFLEDLLLKAKLDINSLRSNLELEKRGLIKDAEDYARIVKFRNGLEEKYPGVTFSKQALFQMNDDGYELEHGQTFSNSELTPQAIRGFRVTITTQDTDFDCWIMDQGRSGEFYYKKTAADRKKFFRENKIQKENEKQFLRHPLMTTLIAENPEGYSIEQATMIYPKPQVA